MEGIAPNCVYVGGSTPGVKCVFCDATSTSGSWRRGWPLVGTQNNSNLCNKCGQKWVKLAKPPSLEAFRVAEEAKNRGERPRPPYGLPTAHGGQSQLQHHHQSVTAKRPSLQGLPGELRPRIRARFVSDGTTDTEQEISSMNSPTQSFTTGLGLAGGGGGGQHQDTPFSAHGLASMDMDGTALVAKHGSHGGQYRSYCVSKYSSVTGNHVLYWVNRAATGESLLAVVGIDARKSGHFIYKSTPFFNTAAANPLNCTNRHEVTSWLASLGVTICISEDALPGPLPELTLDQLKAALNPGSPLITIQGQGGNHKMVDKRGLTSFGGGPIKAPQGASLSGGSVPVASLGGLNVQGEEESGPSGMGGRKTSTRSLAGAKIKPSAGLGLPAISIGGWAGARAGAEKQKDQIAQLPSLGLRFKCSACGSTDHCIEECTTNCISPPALVNSNGTNTFRMMFDDPLMHLDSDLDLDLDLSPSKVLSLSGVAGGFFSGSPGGRDSPSSWNGTQNNNNNVNNNRPTAVAAGTTSSIPESPSFHFSIRIPFNSPPQPPQQQQQQQQQQQGPIIQLPPTVLPPEEQLHRPLAPQALTTFSPHPDLLHWVSALPSAQQEATLTQWASKLTGQISGLPPPEPISEEMVPVGGLRWLPLNEALAILNHLSKMEVNLTLLEKTQISRAVAMLRSHPIQSVASAAEGIVNNWRDCAVKALQLATTTAPKK